MKALLQFENNDNIDGIAGLKDTIQEWLESINVPFETMIKNIEEFEYTRRDGFIPHSWNKGGLDLFAMTDIRSLIGSGDHYGLNIVEWVNEQEKEARQDAVKAGHTEGSDEFYDYVDELTSGDYSCVAYRIRAMYEGDGVLKIYTGYDKDAPYFRFQGKADLELEVKFKTIEELKKKLYKLNKKIQKAQ